MLLEQADACVEVFTSNVEYRSKVVYREDIVNEGKSYLFSINKAKKDFGYKQDYADFKNILKEDKAELEKII